MQTLINVSFSVILVIHLGDTEDLEDMVEEVHKK